jgi:glycosyltransferase involved in cell wall biosynthesis
MVFERCTRVVVLSDAWRDWVEAMAPGATVEVIYNPVCVPALADECGRQPDRVLFMGRLGQRKGTPELMAAGGELARRGRRFAFWLGGDGDAQGTLRQANDAGIAAQVKLLGWVTGSDKQTLLDESAIYCLPSHNEGLPMSILEAMASGLPVVSTRVGGIPEAVTDGVHGRVIEAGDVPALAAALDELLVQPELARRMGLAARQRVIDEFSAEAILPRLSLLYRSLSESRS